jgi:E3 ubiquitin-protein ligase RNF115/126
VQGGGSVDSNINNNSQNPIGSLGDYFVGPGLELLLQHLAENDPNRYGTPPAQKEAVEGLPTVKIEESCLQCSVCLEDFDVGSEAKMMPCKHRFHSDCIFPWLELHSSCPVCRYQLPFDESKLDRGRGGGQGAGMGNARVEETNNGNGEVDDSGRRFSVSLPWPFNSLFSSSSSSGSSPAVENSNAEAREGDSGSRDD